MPLLPISPVAATLPLVAVNVMSLKLCIAALILIALPANAVTAPWLCNAPVVLIVPSVASLAVKWVVPTTVVLPTLCAPVVATIKLPPI